MDRTYVIALIICVGIAIGSTLLTKTFLIDNLLVSLIAAILAVIVVGTIITGVLESRSTPA